MTFIIWSIIRRGCSKVTYDTLVFNLLYPYLFVRVGVDPITSFLLFRIHYRRKWTQLQKAAYSRLKKGFSTPLGKATETNWYFFFFSYDTTCSILGEVGFIVYLRNSPPKNKSFGKIQMIVFKTQTFLPYSNSGSAGRGCVWCHDRSSSKKCKTDFPMQQDLYDIMLS